MFGFHNNKAHLNYSHKTFVDLSAFQRLFSGEIHKHFIVEWEESNWSLILLIEHIKCRYHDTAAAGPNGLLPTHLPNEWPRTARVLPVWHQQVATI